VTWGNVFIRPLKDDIILSDNRTLRQNFHADICRECLWKVISII